MEGMTQAPMASTELGQVRRAYAPARLVLLGDVRTLTETGSMTGNEGINLGFGCIPFDGMILSMTYSTTNNMC